MKLRPPAVVDQTGLSSGPSAAEAQAAAKAAGHEFVPAQLDRDIPAIVDEREHAGVDPDGSRLGLVVRDCGDARLSPLPDPAELPVMPLLALAPPRWALALPSRKPLLKQPN
jgi:hypothetical protein